MTVRLQWYLWLISNGFEIASIPGNKTPHFGELHFQEDISKLVLRSKADEGDINENKKTKRIIDLKGK